MSPFVALLRQRARRDRVQLALWELGTLLLAVSSVAGVRDSYGTETDRANLLLTVLANPVIMLFRGLPSGAGDAAFMLFLILPFLAMLAAFMSSFLAVRHSRADEEAGRAEPVVAAGAGRLLPLLATLTHGLLANLLLGALAAAGFLGSGFPISGSLVSGLAVAAVGVCFLGVGLVSGQLMPTSRSANALAVWLLLGTFLLAGLGNALGSADVARLRVQSSALAWLSPFGWAEQSRPFADDAIAPLLLTIAVGAGCAGVALWLQSRRDVGASIVPARAGRARASWVLSGVFGLAWRLNRGALLGWAIGGFLSGVLATSLSSVLADAANQNASVQALLAQISAQSNVQQGAVIVFFTMVGVLAAAAAVQVLGKARQEESHGQTELLLASPSGRLRWVLAALVWAAVAALGTIAAAVAGAAAGLAKSADPDWSLLGDVLVVAGGQLVAALVFAALTLVLLVFTPRLTIGLGWALVFVGMTLGLFGPLFGFPEWLVNLAPMSSVATVAGSSVDWQGTGWFAAVIVLLTALALWGASRRELASE